MKSDGVSEMETEMDNGPREDNGGVDGNRGKSLTDEGNRNSFQTTVTEEEVDEFFAILRRVHVAARYIEKDNGGMGLKVTAANSKKRKRDESNGVRDGLPVLGLDLNSKPKPDDIL